MLFRPVHNLLLLLNQTLSHDEKLGDEDLSHQEKKANEGKDKTEEVFILHFFCFSVNII